MSRWTVLLRLGRRRRARYVVFEILAGDREEAVQVAVHHASARRVAVVSARQAEGEA